MLHAIDDGPDVLLRCSVYLEYSELAILSRACCEIFSIRAPVHITADKVQRQIEFQKTCAQLINFYSIQQRRLLVTQQSFLLLNLTHWITQKLICRLYHRKVKTSSFQHYLLRSSGHLDGASVANSFIGEYVINMNVALVGKCNCIGFASFMDLVINYMLRQACVCRVLKAQLLDELNLFRCQINFIN